MKVTKIESRTVKTYTLTLEGGETRDKPYSRRPSRYRVERVVVTKRDGNVSRVELGGPVLRKDGTPSLNDASESLYDRGDWPLWLHGMVGGLA